MILCGVDVETTGLDREKDRITEIAWAIFDTENWKKPLACKHFYIHCTIPITESITELTGISNGLLLRAGSSEAAVVDLYVEDLARFRVDHLVAHNAPFDRAFIRNALKRYGLEFEADSWIDTQRDVLYPKSMRSRNLVTLCAEHGFLNPFPHSALFDVFSMMKLLSHYAIEPVLEYRDEPVKVLRAFVDYGDRDKAKKRGFSWENCDAGTFPKQWVKAVKARAVPDEFAGIDFRIEILEIPNEKDDDSKF